MDIDDSIGFISKYLSLEGFGKSTESKKNALRHYNKSISYVNAVMDYANRLKKLHENSQKSTQEIQVN
jgi:hypothetical protein